MPAIDGVGYLAAILVVVANLMRTMIPLRTLAVAANLLFAGYFYLRQLYPSCLLQALLLPINLYRLREMVLLARRVSVAAPGDGMAWLRPFMRRRRCRKGALLFARGDVARDMLFVVRGRFRVVELGVELRAGTVFGELGLLTPDNRRSNSVQCVEAGEVLVIGYDQVRELYFQNPEFGFYFLSLVAARLFHNVERLERRLLEPSGAAADGINR